MNDSRNVTAPLLGRYRPLSDLAKSPIGGLVMALDVPERRVVALRSLPIEGKVPTEISAQLLEAGRWVKGLDDPAVMTPLEVGTQEGLFHAAFSYNLAEPLRGVLRLASFRGSPIPVGVALRIVHDIVLGARAIEACGASPALGDSLCGGLIPDSILVGQDGKTRVCDAGIGAILRRSYEYGQHPDLLAYASPEQVDGTSTIDGRSDVFSIGVFLWEMLANRRLFSATQTQAVADRVRTLSIAPLDTLQRGAAGPMPAAIVAVAKRALERSASDRYPGTTALLQALESQCSEHMATPQTVQHYMAGLLGNIFDTRNRAMERAVGNLESVAAPGSLSPPAPAFGANLDLRPRAATSRIPPPLAGVSDRPLAASDLPGRDAGGLAVPNADSLAPDTVRDPVEDRPKLPSLPPPPMRSSKPAPSASPRPPMIPAIPTLPKRFELPGAALFATPGVPAVKPVQPVADVTAVTESAPEPAPTASESKVNPVGPTIRAPAAPQPPEPPTAKEPAQPPHSKSRVAWIAILSLAGCAFVGGIAIRRCAFQSNRTISPGRVDVARSVEVQDAMAASSAAELLKSTDASVADASEGDAGALASDAGMPSTTAKPKPAPVRQYVRKPAPRSSSKVAKGRGKTTKTR